MTEHDSCFLCGCVPLEEAIPAVLATINAEQRAILPRITAALGAMSEDDKATFYSWLSGTLARPPLDRVDGPWAPIVEVLDALLWDVADRTFDPGSPEVAGWLIPLPHRRVIEARHGIRHLPHGDGTTTTVATDASGFVR